MEETEHIEIIDKSAVGKQSHNSGHPRECVACKREISSAAILCPNCSSYQAKWKNNIQFYGGFAGLLTALLTYVASTLPQVFADFMGKDQVKIVAFDSGTNLVLQNAGAGDVFISHLSIDHRVEPYVFSEMLPINKVLQRRQFLVHDFKSGKTREDWAPLTYYTESQWKTFVKRTEHFVKNQCVVYSYYDLNDPGYQRLKSLFAQDRFRTLPVEVLLAFDSGFNGKRVNQRVTAVALPYLNVKNPACKKLKEQLSSDKHVS